MWTYFLKTVNLEPIKKKQKNKELCRNNYDRKLKSARKLKPSLRSYMSCSIQLESRLGIWGQKANSKLSPAA